MGLEIESFKMCIYCLLMISGIKCIIITVKCIIIVNSSKGKHFNETHVTLCSSSVA